MAAKKVATVKEGDRFTAKAGARLRKLGLGYIADQVVQAKAEGDAGQWVCIDCGEPFQNNLSANMHPRSHRLAWRNFKTGNIEVP